MGHPCGRGEPMKRAWRAAGGSLLWVLAAGAGAAPEALPRKAAADESYPGVVVQYDTLRNAQGERLRLIVTRPQHSAGKVAVIFVAGWLSCDTVEAPAGTMGAPQRVFRALAQLPGFATVRLEKAGVGDSEGDCGASDFSAELAAYRQAFRALGSYRFVDTTRVFVFGLSNGGGFAPLVAEAAPVRGYVVVGGWIKTWFEHMLEIERRRLALAGVPAAELDARMKDVAQLYAAYLLQRQSPREIFARQPRLQALWEGDAGQQYGRPVRYYQQLQELDLMRAWSQVHAPLLVLRGEFDWIMSRADLETMAALVNANAPGAAQFVELPLTGHTLEHYASLEAAFAGKQGPFEDAIAQRIAAWFAAQR